MDDTYSRSSLRERILNDLRNIVKQIYHEAVNDELGPENKTYICLTLIKNLDEALRHGLKQLHLGYWKPISKILHPQTLKSIDELPANDPSENNGLTKGKAWIALSLRDDSFISYVQCLVSESCLDKYYEDWSILRMNDSCNHFMSILSGLNNVIFTFQIEHLNKPPSCCNFGIKIISNDDKQVIPLSLNGSKSSIDLTTSTTSLTSPVDSGVHIQDSTSDVEHIVDSKQIDIDFLNGNIPETVLLRKSKKDTKRHVSFHEDIIYKSPERCRRLKWDSENLRYSWGGEELDSSILKESDFIDAKLQKSSTPVKALDINERGTPEGEETPSSLEQIKQNNKSQKSIIVKRFLQSIKKQSKIKQIYKKYDCTDQKYKKVKIDMKLVRETNEEIKRELESRPKVLISKNEVCLDVKMVKDMIRNQSIYKTYKLRDYLFIITNANVYLINRNLETKRISFKSLTKIVVYPDSQIFLIYECDDEFHTFVTGEADLTNEVIGRLELSMRRNQFDPPLVYMLHHEDLAMLKRDLVQKLAIGKREKLVYCGAVRLDKENDLLNMVLPTSKRGFLMYRDLRAGDSWIPGDFSLRNGILYLFGDESNFPKLAINISTACQSCNRTKSPDRPHTFQISLIEKELDFYSESNHFYEDTSTKSKLLKSDTRHLLSGLRQKVNKFFTFGGPKETGYVLEFAAANECELAEWLQMIIQASCGDSCEEATKEDLIEGALWLTTDSLIITNEIYSLKSKTEIISCAQLRDVAAFRIGESEKDYFTVIEFICMEASSTSGDWILYMSSREELEKLKSTLQSLWKLNEKFPMEYLREGRLINRCRKSQESLFYNYWAQLLQ